MCLPLSYTLETPRCHLRSPSRNDISSVFQAAQYDGFCDGMRWDPPETEEELLSPYYANIEAWEAGIAYTFSIDCKETGFLIGRIVTRHQEDETWDLGFWTHPVQQGKGYMTEVVASLLSLAFTQLDAKEVIASHAVWNLASEIVLKRNGMSFLKHIPRGFEKKSGWVELNLLGITKQQWHNINNTSSS